jgi:hypothetical protein
MGDGPMGWEFTGRVCRCVLRGVSLLCGCLVLGLLYDLVFVVMLQGGVRYAVPRSIRMQELDALEATMSQADRQLVEEAFCAPNPSGVRTFCGRPEDLSPSSRLSRIMARALCEREGVRASTVSAARILGAEYATLGYDLADLRMKAACSAVRSLVGCLVVLWASHRLRSQALAQAR